jgi:hypothetical protein
MLSDFGVNFYKNNIFTTDCRLIRQYFGNYKENDFIYNKNDLKIELIRIIEGEKS